MVNKKNVALAHFEQTIGELEEKYNRQKQTECMDLHNAIVDVLVEHKATPQNAITVLSEILFEMLSARVQEIYGNVVVPEGSVPLKKNVKSKTPLLKKEGSEEVQEERPSDITIQ